VEISVVNDDLCCYTSKDFFHGGKNTEIKSLAVNISLTHKGKHIGGCQ
jgi:hypothetical protein